MARLSGEGSSRNPPARMTPKPDSKAKAANHTDQKTDVKKVSCFNCGGPHYARDCPPENRKTARGYAVRIADEDAMETTRDDASKHHSTRSHADPKDDAPPRSAEQDSGSKHSDHLEGKQYDPDDAGEYHFDSEGDSEPVYSRATRIIATPN